MLSDVKTEAREISINWFLERVFGLRGGLGGVSWLVGVGEDGGLLLGSLVWIAKLEEELGLIWCDFGLSGSVSK